MMKIPFENPWKLSIFQFCPYFSTCLSLKSGSPPPIKNFVFEINKDRSINLTKSTLEAETCNLSKHLKLGAFFTTFLQYLAKNHLVMEWSSWLPYKSGFINSYILDTSKDRPNTLSSLELIEQSVHELVGGSTEPPPPPPPPP